jgi:hypothetical protein
MNFRNRQSGPFLKQGLNTIKTPRVYGHCIPDFHFEEDFDEISTWGMVICLLWQMCPSDILALHFILDWLKEEAQTKDINRLLGDLETLRVIKEIAQNKIWRFGQLGPFISESAKCILARHSRQCSIADATTSHLVRSLGNERGLDAAMESFYLPLQPKRKAGPREDARRVCENPVCSFVESGVTKFPKCGRCGKVSYCSSSCQKCHWKVHKLSCLPKQGVKTEKTRDI